MWFLDKEKINLTKITNLTSTRTRLPQNNLTNILYIFIKKSIHKYEKKKKTATTCSKLSKKNDTEQYKITDI